jgi:hypothetical protein
MCLLEGLAMGKPVIAPENVGMVGEFAETGHMRRYPAGKIEALVQLVTDCYTKKLRRTDLVKERTWDAWALAHHQLFQRLLHKQSGTMPRPAAAFRFGMMGELEIPPGIEVGALEDGVDEAAAHLYFGEYGAAWSVFKRLLPRYPFVGKLMQSIPKQQEAKVDRKPASKATGQKNAPVAKRLRKKANRTLTG